MQFLLSAFSSDNSQQSDNFELSEYELAVIKNAAMGVRKLDFLLRLLAVGNVSASPLPLQSTDLPKMLFLVDKGSSGTPWQPNGGSAAAEGDFVEITSPLSITLKPYCGSNPFLLLLLLRLKYEGCRQ